MLSEGQFGTLAAQRKAHQEAHPESYSGTGRGLVEKAYLAVQGISHEGMTRERGTELVQAHREGIRQANRTRSSRQVRIPRTKMPANDPEDY